MKRKLIIIVAIVLTVFTIPSYANESESVNNKNTGTLGIANRVIFVVEGFYWTDNQLIYYTDYKTLDTFPLCTNPICDHVDQRKCTAVLSRDFQIIDDKLYSTDYYMDEYGVCLFEMNLGTFKENRVMTLINDGILSHASELFEIYDNHVIYLSDYGSVRVVSLDNPAADVKILFASTEEDVEVITREEGFSGIEPYAWTFWGDERCLYFMGSQQLKGASRPYSSRNANCLYRYDLESELCELVWTLPTSDEVGDWKLEGISTNGWYILNHCLYFFLTGNGFWKTDLQTGQTEMLSETDVNGTAFYNGEYVFVNNSDEESMDYNGFKQERRSISVFDMNGTYLSTVDLQELYERNENETIYISILGADHEDIIIECFGVPTNYANYKISRYIINAFSGEKREFGP